jgi:hypothetical protein
MLFIARFRLRAARAGEARLSDAPSSSPMARRAAVKESEVDHVDSSPAALFCSFDGQFYTDSIRNRAHASFDRGPAQSGRAFNLAP